VQGAIAEHQHALATQCIQSGMSRRGDGWDNAVGESFFSNSAPDVGAF
jgi:hypothetical protein